METISKENRKRVIWSFVKPYRVQFITLFLCVIATSFMEMLFPYTYSILIDEIFYHKNLKFFVTITIIYFILFAGMILITMLLVALKAYLTTSYVFNIRKTIFDKVMNLRAKYLDNCNTGDLITIINIDSEAFLNMIHRNVFYLLGDAIRFAAAIVFIFIINKDIGLFLLFIVPVVVYTTKMFSKKSEKIFSDNRQKYGKYISWLFEIIDGVREVKLFSSEKFVKIKYFRFWKELIKNKIKVNLITLLSERANTLITLIADLFIYIISAFFILKGELTIGGFIAVIEYFNSAKFFFTMLSEVSVISKKNNLVSIDKVLNLLFEENEQKERGIKKDLVLNKGQVLFKNICFSYNDENNVLDNFELKVNPNEKIAIVGSSGSGKSTIINLLLGLYDSYKGNIYIDNQDIRNCSLNSIRRNIGVVRQESLIFKESIRYNLLIGNPQANDKEIWETLKNVQAFDFVNNLPKKLDTVIGKGEAGLSGGQIQRLAIARTLLKNPKILVFDEATSSLDYETENFIRFAIENICKNRTAIITAHRLSTILGSDRVVVLHNGKIISIGHHSELLERCSLYQKLFKEQYFYDNK